MLIRNILFTLRAAVGVAILSLTYFVFIAALIPFFTARSSPVERISLLLVVAVLRAVERRVVLRAGLARLDVLRLVVRRGLAERLVVLLRDELLRVVLLRAGLARLDVLRLVERRGLAERLVVRRTVVLQDVVVGTNLFVKERAIAALQSIVYLREKQSKIHSQY